MPKKLLAGLRYGLLCSGAVLLAISGFILAEARLWQIDQGRELEKLVKEEAKRAPVEARPAPNSLIGRMEIDRIGLSAIVLEGTDSTTLRRAVGHIPGSALPGQAGNAILAGHRDTFFRALREAQPNDTIRLTTPAGTYDYVIEATKVVDPNETSLLRSSQDSTLTLVTCYPFYYIGSAPKRFIVRAGLSH